MIHQLCKRDIEAADLPAKVNATTDRKEALKGANYVLSFVRVGGLEAFATDIDIPLKYGVDQCVGDTLCAVVLCMPNGPFRCCLISVKISADYVRRVACS